MKLTIIVLLPNIILVDHSRHTNQYNSLDTYALTMEGQLPSGEHCVLKKGYL